MLEPLRIAWERRQEPIQPRVVYLDFVHSAPRSRR
jgi:hypothetical protein